MCHPRACRLRASPNRQTVENYFNSHLNTIPDSCTIGCCFAPLLAALTSRYVFDSNMVLGFPYLPTINS